MNAFQPQEDSGSRQGTKSDSRLKSIRETGAELALECSGDPSIGKVFFLKQFHNDSYYLPGDLPIIGRYQEKVLRALDTLKVKVVFDEGTSHYIARSGAEDRDDVLAELLSLANDSDFGTKLPDDISEIFPGLEIPQECTEEQRAAIAKLGPGLTYALLRPDVSLFPSKTYEELQQFIAASNASPEDIVASGVSPEDFDEKLDRIQERLVTRHIIEFLDSHPGEEIALIFGRLHEFGAASFGYRDESRAPLVVGADWPLAADSVINTNSFVIASEIVKGERPLGDLSRFEEFHPVLFAELDVQQQLEVLERVRPVVLFATDREQYTTYLFESAKSHEVRMKIMEHLSAGTGPFSVMLR